MLSPDLQWTVIWMTLKTAGTSGNVTLQWAEDTSSGTITMQGSNSGSGAGYASFMKATRIA
jgi:hypothetical protein